MVTLRVNDKKVQVPERWEEVSTALYQRIVEEWEPNKPIAERDRVLLFSLLTGTNYKSIMASRDYHLEGMVYQCTNFVFTGDLAGLPVPDRLVLDGVKIPLPKDLGALTIGQNVHVRQALTKAAGSHMILSKVVAIYLQPIVDSLVSHTKSEFDFERVRDLEEKILLLPITEVFPIGFFFLRKLGVYGMSWRNRLSRNLTRILGDALRLPKWPKPIVWTHGLKFH